MHFLLRKTFSFCLFFAGCNIIGAGTEGIHRGLIPMCAYIALFPLFTAQHTIPGVSPGEPPTINVQHSVCVSFRCRKCGMVTQPNSKSFFQATCLDNEKLVECVSYVFVCPVLILLGIFGCVANVLLISGSGFNSVTFFYLRALSLSDLCYLLSVCFNLVEILVLTPYGMGQDEIVQMFYLTHIDHILSNTFIGTSGFLIVLVTIDRYHCICRPTK